MKQNGVPLQARTGRDLQKYDAGHRLVAGCIPIRHVQRNGSQHVEILLITSKSSNLLVLPKGGWEVDETLEAAAARETLEEAGVIGDLEGAKRTKRSDAVSEEITWPRRRFKFVYVGRSMSKLRRQISYRASLSTWLVTSVCSRSECTHSTVLYGSTHAEEICGHDHTVKLILLFLP